MILNRRRHLAAWGQGSIPLCLCLTISFVTNLAGADPNDKHKQQRRLQMMDVFDLEYASEPQISPDGSEIVYVRNFMDVMKDESRSSLWSVKYDGSRHRPLTDGNGAQRHPRWSPDGTRLAYIATANGSPQLYLRWIDTGQTARLTQLTRPPASLSWSPDGKWIAFSMLVPEEAEPLVAMPKAPKDAEWAEPAKVVRQFTYRFDGKGYLEDGYQQVFVVSSEGGTPRQLTFGPYHHEGEFAWTPDSEHLILSANRQENWEMHPRESDLYELKVSDGTIRRLTNRNGPDMAPTVSPDGSKIAYIGFDDEMLGYQIAELYVMSRNGDQPRSLTPQLDRLVHSPKFAGDNAGIYFLYDDYGDTKIGYSNLTGRPTTVASQVGGTMLGRPYSSGSFSVSNSGKIAFTKTTFDHPGDVATAQIDVDRDARITQLNDDVFSHKQLAEPEEFWINSSFDGQRIQAWLLKPPGFSRDQTYPLILEIHGGPFANYGPRFAAEMQLYAAAGYVVLYVNPRGSTGYGHDFANLIHHNYPGQDYDDLMTAVDDVVGRGYINKDELFVTGGSGGGVLTAWIIGKTDRFRAAVVAKPVINWYSFALTADAYNYFYKYWFPGFPWDHAEEYLRRSPISLVGNVTTPTMLITGEEDFRTPIAETEQYYQALKLRQIETVLVRIPGASHAIAARPSRLIAKAAHVLAWFDNHRQKGGD